MKKLTILMLLTASLLTACGQEAPKENPMRLKSSCHESFFEGQVTDTLETQYFYDTENRVLQTQILRNGAPDTITDYVYSEQMENVLKITSDSEKVLSEETVWYTYDDQGRVIRSENYNGNQQLTAITEYAFDEQGNQTQLDITRKNVGDLGDVISRTRMTYDNQGNLIRTDVEWAPMDGNTYAITEYQNGREVKTTTYSAEDDSIQSWQESTYTEDGAKVTTAFDSGGNPVSKNISTYDEYGNVLTNESYVLNHTEFYDPEQPVSRTTNTYEAKK